MKYAVVTGASQGIGREVALLLSQKKYFVFLLGRNTSKLANVQESIEQIGGEAEVIQIELSDFPNIKNIASLIANKTKHIDILANIAGMYHDDNKHFFGIPFEEYPDEAIISNVSSILIGHVLLTKHLVKLMDQSSSIVNMSGSFDEGETGVISDFLTKKGIELFTQQLPLELESKSVRVNAVRPDFVFTENVQKFFPEVKKEEALDPKNVAAKIIDLAEDATKNGQIIDIKRK